MADDYLGYGNLALTTPVFSTGITNPELLSSPIVGRRAVLASSATADFLLTTRQAGIWMLGLAGLSVRSTGSPSVTFAFSDLAQGGSDLGSFTYSISMADGYDLKAWILSEALPAATWMRVTFTACATVGEVWASPAVNPYLGIETDMSAGRAPLSVIYESPLTGAATAMKRPAPMVCGFNFMAVDDDEWLALDTLRRQSTNFYQVWLIRELGSTLQDQRMILGRLVDLAREQAVAPLLTRFPFEIRQTL